MLSPRDCLHLRIFLAYADRARARFCWTRRNGAWGLRWLCGWLGGVDADLDRLAELVLLFYLGLV